MELAEEYKEAISLFDAGDRAGAVVKLRELWCKAPDGAMKLDAGLRLLAILNRVDDHKELLQLCPEIEALSLKLSDKGAAGYAVGCFALTYAQKLPSLFHRQKNITLPSGWFGFALDREKEEHEKLSARVNEIERGMDELFAKAMKLTEDNPTARANVLHFQVQAYANRVTLFDFQNMRTSSVLLHKAGKLIGIQFFFIFSRKARKQRGRLMATLRKRYREMIAAYRLAKDELGEAYGYYSWTQHHKLQFCFLRAKWTLWRAERIALRLDNKLLLSQIQLLKESLALKNEDVDGNEVDYHDMS